MCAPGSYWRAAGADMRGQDLRSPMGGGLRPGSWCFGRAGAGLESVRVAGDGFSGAAGVAAGLAEKIGEALLQGCDGFPQARVGDLFDQAAPLVADAGGGEEVLALLGVVFEVVQFFDVPETS